MEIVSPGLLTTIQDAGRKGYGRFGVSQSGPMDKRAFRLANMLVGNDRDATQLEMTLLGATVRFGADVMVALTGANMQPSLNGSPAPMYQAFAVRAGDVLAMGMAVTGCRAYLAVSGGLDAPLVLGSRSTTPKNRLGGLEGWPLRAGDAVGFCDGSAAGHGVCAATVTQGRRIAPEITPAGVKTLRVVMGPQDDAFTPQGIHDFLHTDFRISNESDRMGYRLQGARIAHKTDGNILSDGIAMGSVQVPGDGSPILMMADRQSIGGYAKIAVVASVDLPVAAQCRPGDAIRFRAIGVEEAQALYRAYEAEMQALERSLGEWDTGKHVQEHLLGAGSSTAHPQERLWEAWGETHLQEHSPGERDGGMDVWDKPVEATKRTYRIAVNGVEYNVEVVEYGFD
jgi:biotin-dependent carboxylase-like uncharacterized protein